MSDRQMAILFLVPSALVIGFLGVYPVIRTILLSLFVKGTLSPKIGPFVGVSNLVNILKSYQFGRALLNSIIWTGGTVAFQFIFGLIFSLMLYKEFRGRNIMRSIIIFPYLIPVVVAVLVWKYMFNDLIGIVNHIVYLLGYRKTIGWLSNPNTAMFSAIMTGTWKYFPFMVICFLARLQTVSLELYDAARVDGANWWQEFVHITFPIMKPVVMIVLLLRTIWMFNNYDFLALLTGGGPGFTTTTLPILIYRKIFAEFSMSGGAAMGVFMFLILYVTASLYLFLYERAEQELG